MAEEKSTGPGAARFLTTYEEDNHCEAALLRQVLALHPETTLTKAELIREMTAGAMTESEVDAHERALRDLAAVGLLHPPRGNGFVRPTRAAQRFCELQEGV